MFRTEFRPTFPFHLSIRSSYCIIEIIYWCSYDKALLGQREVHAVKLVRLYLLLFIRSCKFCLSKKMHHWNVFLYLECMCWRVTIYFFIEINRSFEREKKLLPITGFIYKFAIQYRLKLSMICFPSQKIDFIVWMFYV